MCKAIEIFIENANNVQKFASNIFSILPSNSLIEFIIQYLLRISITCVNAVINDIRLSAMQGKNLSKGIKKSY